MGNTWQNSAKKKNSRILLEEKMEMGDLIAENHSQ